MSEFDTERASWDAELYELALAVARHELGHWFAARDCGFQPNGITIAIDQMRDTSHSGSAEISDHVGLASIDAIIWYLEARIITLWSGVQAESLHGDNIDQMKGEQLIETSGRYDFINAASYLRLLRNILHPTTEAKKAAQEELSAVEQRLMLTSKEIVESASSAIHELAAELAGRVKALKVDYSITQNEIEGIEETKKWIAIRASVPFNHAKRS